MKDKKYIILTASAVLLVAISAGWLVAKYYLFPENTAQEPFIELKDGMPEGKKIPDENGSDVVPVKIFYPSEAGLSVEEKNVRNSRLPVKMAELILAEYLKGLKEGLGDTKLLGVYRDSSNIFYIDLSDEFRRNFAGDAGQEYYLLKSLFETVMVNLPGTEDVKLLIEGKEVDSIGGHFSCFSPLKEIFQEEDRKPGVNDRKPE